MKKVFYAAVAAFSLVTAPTLAMAAPTAPVVTPLTQPAKETVSGDSQLRGTPLPFVGLAFIVLTVGLILIINHKGSGNPTSP